MSFPLRCCISYCIPAVCTSVTQQSEVKSKFWFSGNATCARKHNCVVFDHTYTHTTVLYAMKVLLLCCTNCKVLCFCYLLRYYHLVRLMHMSMSILCNAISDITNFVTCTFNCDLLHTYYVLILNFYKLLCLILGNIIKMLCSIWSVAVSLYKCVVQYAICGFGCKYILSTCLQENGLGVESSLINSLDRKQN